jgi:hypothetical protein
MKYKSTDICKCGHYNADHENRNSIFGNLREICWGCAAMASKSLLLEDSYHSFKLNNLDYLQRLYNEKHKIK